VKRKKDCRLFFDVREIRFTSDGYNLTMGASSQCERQDDEQ